MRQSRKFESIGTGFLALGVVVAPLVGGGIAPAAAAPVTLLASDFEDGVAAPWAARGTAAIEVVSTDGHDSAHSLSVSGRTADWHGAQTSIVDLVEAGQTYTVSGWVRLSEPGSTEMKFTVAETPENYRQVSTPATVTDAGWVELAGSYTVPAGLTGAALYVEAVDPTASFLLDDVSVVGEPADPDAVAPGGAVDPTIAQVTTARGSGDVAALTFDDGPNPGETDRLLDFLAANDIDATFCVIGQNITAPGGAELLNRMVAEGHTLCNHTTSYADMGSWTPEQIEADLTANLRIIRDALGDPIAPVPYFRAPNGSWGQSPQVAVDLGMQPLGLGNLIFDWDGNDLSEATLTENLRGAITPGAVVLVHDGGGDRTNSIAAVETVVAERLAEGWTFTMPAERGATSGGGDTTTTVTSLDFDAESIEPWTASGSPTLAYVDADGGKALSITRAADYEGIQSPVGLLEAETVYTFSMRARLPEGTAGTADIRFVVKPAYSWVGNATINGDGWTDVTGTFTVPADVDPAQTQVYLGTSDVGGAPYTVLVDDILITAPGGGGSGEVVNLVFDFEDGLQGWVPRADADGAPTVATTTTEAHGGAQAALVSDRNGQGDGIAYDVTGVFETGVTYDITAWVKMAAGGETDDIWLSAQRVTDGASAFDTVGQFTGITSGQWHQVTASYTMPGADTTLLYFETSYNTGGPGAFLVDDVSIRSQDEREVQDLLPLKDTMDVPVGVAIDSRETLGSAAELTLRHVDQITAENHMKVEAWYDETQTLRMHPEAIALMDFAAANDLRVYGHVLVWHSQTPEWFFQDDAGQPLTTSEADKQEMRDRMRTHIFGVAEAIANEYGAFGSATNPLVAWDVVNEVVADGTEFADGLRRSEWYRILGEEFIDLAFIYAEEAFNGQYAAEGVERPVTLFINDYNTEQGGKQGRYFDLVNRLLDRGVPLDGVGHQFHVSLSTPVAALEAAIVRFADLPVTQVVTELDVTVGTPVTEANLIEQGYYYRDAFRVLREHSDELYSVTLWGLTDNRSWRSEQAPLLFDAQLQAKPAYYGAVDGEIPGRVIAELVFQGSVPLDGDATTSLEWRTLPLHEVEQVADFQLRWEADHLTTYVAVTDATVDATDAVSVVVAGQTVTVSRDGSGDAPAVVTETDGGWTAVVHVPLAGATVGSTVEADLRVTDGATTTSWATPEAPAQLTLVEPLSYLEVVESEVAPTVDGTIDEVWSSANVVTTDKQIEGSADGAATAAVRTLWSEDGSTLYLLAEVTDDQLDVSGSDPWIQDSVEVFLDAGNYRNGPYRYDDTQIRINLENVVSFGTGDETFQRNRLTSATSVTADGYLVEASISLLEEGGPGTFHGLDFQVNDGTDGARTSVRTWADPTGLGYQSTARWGVAQLVETYVPPVIDPAISLGADVVARGGSLRVELSGFEPGGTVELTLERDKPGRGHRPMDLGQVTIGADGTASVTVTVPAGAKTGPATVVASQGDLSASQQVTVLNKSKQAGPAARV